MRSILIAPGDFGPALGTLVSQRRLVVRTVGAIDGDLLPVVANVARGNLRVLELVPARHVQGLRVLQIAPGHQGIFPTLVAPRIAPFDLYGVFVMGDIALFEGNLRVVMVKVAAVSPDFAGIVADGRVIRPLPGRLRYPVRMRWR